MNIKAYVCEFIGTFALIFFGVGSIGASHGNIVAIALAHGLAIAILVSALGAISGGHFNPQISFGLWIGHKITTTTLIMYWVFQLAGGIVGAWMIIYCVPGAQGTPELGPSVTMTQAFILEAIGAFFLTFVVYGTAVDKRAAKMGGLFIGLTITIAILCFGPQTGASINPARFFGPAFIEHAVTQNGLIIYILGPLLGGLVAGILYNYVLLEKPVETLSAAPPELASSEGSV